MRGEVPSTNTHTINARIHNAYILTLQTEGYHRVECFGAEHNARIFAGVPVVAPPQPRKTTKR